MRLSGDLEALPINVTLCGELGGGYWVEPDSDYRVVFDWWVVVNCLECQVERALIEVEHVLQCKPKHLQLWRWDSGQMWDVVVNHEKTLLPTAMSPVHRARVDWLTQSLKVAA